MKWYGILALVFLLSCLAGIVIYGMNPGSSSTSNVDDKTQTELLITNEQVSETYDAVLCDAEWKSYDHNVAQSQKYNAVDDLFYKSIYEHNISNNIEIIKQVCE